jgi:hypothetical protein
MHKRAFSAPGNSNRSNPRSVNFSFSEVKMNIRKLYTAVPIVVGLLLLLSALTALADTAVSDPTGLYEELPPGVQSITYTTTVQSSVVATSYLPLISLNDDGQLLFALVKSYPGQQHSVMNWNPELFQAAKIRATEISELPAPSCIHEGPSGGPNYVAQQLADFELPTFYDHGRNGNNMESLACGHRTLQDALEALVGMSASVLGTGDNPFWRHQTEFVIAHHFREGSQYGHYWVFLGSHPEGATQP